MFPIRVFFPLTSASVMEKRLREREKHAAKEKAQDARNDIVEVKNLSGRPQQCPPGS